MHFRNFGSPALLTQLSSGVRQEVNLPLSPAREPISFMARPLITFGTATSTPTTGSTIITVKRSPLCAKTILAEHSEVHCSEAQPVRPAALTFLALTKDSALRNRKPLQSNTSLTSR